jgi:nucleolar protein 56
MNNFLITKWFGCFLIDENCKIIEKNIFPQDEESLLVILKKIKDNKVLTEEINIAKDHFPIVAEKRLQQLGSYEPYNEFFLKYNINYDTYGFSIDLLQKMLCKLTEKLIDNKLSLVDFQVIQQVNALDEMQHIANMLGERIASWDIYPSKNKFQIPLKQVIESVEINQAKLKEQIELTVKDLAPNVCELTGSMIAARLLAHAGSLRKLAMLPSSSIQLLGAEKALFRFKKEGGKPPKHGVIFQHPLISKVPYNQRGKNARLLSAKISIAAKADMFTKRYIAPSLKEMLSDQIKHK